MAYVKKRALSDAIIEDQQIGWANNKGLLKHLEKLGFTDAEIMSTGMFYYDSQDQLIGRFRNRVSFPYWTSGGRVDYVGMRKTPWTEESPAEQAKYKKLPVHDEHHNRHIAPVIKNHLHNELILDSKPEKLVLPKGLLTMFPR